jgi:DNA invertase Pin-like site-specific DNA recombinase
MTKERFAKRVKAGMRAARRRGVRLGRPPLVFDRVEVLVLYLRGNSIRQIASALGINRDAIHRTIRLA